MTLDDVLREAAEMLQNPDRQEAQEVIMEIVDDLLVENPEVQAAFSAIRRRGSEEWARDEVARAFLGVYWHVANQTERVRAAGGPDELMRQTFEALREGANAKDLFE